MIYVLYLETHMDGKDTNGFNEEWLYLLEEVILSDTATDMVRRHKRLMQLHHDMKYSRPVKKQIKKKQPTGIPSRIDETDLKERLRHKLMEEQIYLRDDLTLASLAHELDVEPHNLSRFLNTHLHTTFNTLVNTCRVSAAKSMLTSDFKGSILDIAFSVGFNSKASFNRIFKKMTGSTPKQYRHNLCSCSSK